MGSKNSKIIPEKLLIRLKRRVLKGFNTGERPGNNRRDRKRYKYRKR